jgi:hypothetical protein
MILLLPGGGSWDRGAGCSDAASACLSLPTAADYDCEGGRRRDEAAKLGALEGVTVAAVV